MRTCGIYLITVLRPDNWPMYYVGQSNNIRQRLKSHFWALKSGRHDNPRMQRAWEKYGEQSFRHEILEECDSAMLDALEQWWIDEMIGSVRCLNIANFSSCVMRGLSFSEEHKRKIAQAQTGENHYNFGKPLSEEHRRRISEGGRGKRRSEETRAAISKASKGDKNPMFGKVGLQNKKSKAVIARNIETGNETLFESATLAERSGFDQAAISRCCSGKNKYHKGHTWRFATPQDLVSQPPV